jgi:outer membrane protein TolC
LNYIAKFLIAGVFVAISTASPAETLEQAWADALGAHQQLASAAARRESARLDVEAARAGRLPRIDVDGSYAGLDASPRFDFGNGAISEPLFADDVLAMAGAQLSVPLYMGGSINAGIDAATSAADASEEQYVALMQDIKLATGEHYVQVLRSESALAVARSNVASLEAHTAIAENRYRTGEVPHNDFLAASVSLANARQGLVQAENVLDLARAAYNRFLGRSLDAAVALDPAIGADGSVSAQHSLADLQDMALAGRAELSSMAAQEQALRKQSKATRGRARPQLALTGGYRFLDNQFLDTDDAWMAGLSFRWNLFDGGRTRKQAASLERQAMAVGHSRSDLQTAITLQVRKAWNDRREAEHRSGVAAAAVEQAAENLRVVRNRYEAGASTNAEVLDAEALRVQALGNRDDSHYGQAIARLRLARAVGLL